MKRFVLIIIIGFLFAGNIYAGPNVIWQMHDDFNDNAFNNDIWYSANGLQPEEIEGRLYLDYAGDNNVWIGTVESVKGVQAELELSNSTVLNDDSDIQVGLSVLGNNYFQYSIEFALSSSDEANKAQIEITIYENTDANTPHTKVYDYDIPNAEYDKKYTFSITINGDIVNFSTCAGGAKPPV